MPTLASKIRIKINDFDFKSDIKYRLFLSSLNNLEEELIEEIIHSSVEFNISDISLSIEVDNETLFKALNKIASIGLISISNEKILVNKKLRKYFEFQMTKFSNKFKANIPFLKKILNKVDIHFLPSWYAIPKSSDDIFNSIVDKYIKSPKKYLNYIKHLSFENPVIKQIIQDLFKSPTYQLRSQDILDKYNLSKEEFKYIAILLEFHLVCFVCYSYNEKTNIWEEVIVPLHELRVYLLNIKNTFNNAITNDLNNTLTGNFRFSKDLTNLLNILNEKNINCSFDLKISKEDTQLILEQLKLNNDFEWYLNLLLKTAFNLDFIKLNDNILSINKLKSIPINSLSSYIYSHPKNKFDNEKLNILINRMNFIRIEKFLSYAPVDKWINFYKIKEAITFSPSKMLSSKLTKNMKFWSYLTPEISDIDIEFIESSICQHIFQAGIVDIAKQDDTLFFKVNKTGEKIIKSEI